MHVPTGSKFLWSDSIESQLTFDSLELWCHSLQWIVSTVDRIQAVHRFMQRSDCRFAIDLINMLQFYCSIICLDICARSDWKFNLKIWNILKFSNFMIIGYLLCPAVNNPSTISKQQIKLQLRNAFRFSIYEI